jgi:hypothetical protein
MPKSRLGLSVLSACFVLLSGLGCESEADRGFRASVVPVLEQAATLESRIQVELPSNAWVPTMPAPIPDSLNPTRRIESDGARAVEELKGFRSAVTLLPKPKDHALRFLRSTLESLGVAGDRKIQWSMMARRAMFPYGIPTYGYMEHMNVISWSGRVEGVYADQFSDALLTTAAAERVALGSTILRDKGVWLDPRGSHPSSRRRPTFLSQPESLVTQREKRVRTEIAMMGREE